MDDVKSAWLLRLGPHTCYNGVHNGLPSSNAELILKADLSSDRRLQFAFVKPESLVTANQLCGREYVLGSCTHRPSRQESRGCPNVAVGRRKAKPVIGAKS